MASRDVGTLGDNACTGTAQPAMEEHTPSTQSVSSGTDDPGPMEIKLNKILDRLDTMDTGMAELKQAIAVVSGTVGTIDSTSATFRNNYTADVDKMTKLLEEAKAENELERRLHLITRSELACARQKCRSMEVMINTLENKLRLENIRIDGKMEEDGEDLRRFIFDLAAGIGVKNMVAGDIINTHRIGAKQQSRRNRPRTIMVTFASTAIRNQFYYARTNLKKHDRLKRIYLNDDVTPLTKRQREEFRSVAELARKQGAEVRIHSDGMIIDGKKYYHGEPQSLPEKYSLTNARTVEEGGELYFASEHSFLSNFSPSPIVIGTTVYATAEHMFQAYKCKHAVELELMRRVTEAPTPLDAKKLAGAIHETPEWRQARDGIMKKVIDDKFKQNPDLVEKLLATGDKCLNEATHNDYFGIGVPLHAHQIKDKGYAGANKLGLMLMAKRDSIRSERA